MKYKDGRTPRREAAEFVSIYKDTVLADFRSHSKKTRSPIANAVEYYIKKFFDNAHRVSTHRKRSIQ